MTVTLLHQLCLFLSLVMSQCFVSVHHEQAHHKQAQHKQASRTKISCLFAQRREPKHQNSTKITPTLPGPVDCFLLKRQAQSLREEADRLKAAVEQEKEAKLVKENATVDRWLEALIVNQTISDDLQLLNTVDQAMGVLRDKRYSAEQVNKMFQRLCDQTPSISRSNCPPMMELLVEAAGKLDSLDRDENPNKRWSGRIEQRLRKKLFAKDWGFELEDEPESTRFL